MGNKHTQMPHELGMMNKSILLKPVDKLVYVYLRSYADKNLQTFVSMDTLAERCELSWKTVSDSIVRLLEAQELFLVSDDSGRRCRTYKIAKDERHFEMFSQDFLDHLKEQDFTISEKCVLICLHEHSYKTQTYGELKGTLVQMANSINMPEKSFKRAMLSLKKKGVIKDEYNHENQLVRRVE
jgi:DNA-binding MarR family transcriptional regulator